jgi:hypothetical protein
MIKFQKDNIEKCWWCGSETNLSGEHKIKRTDIERALNEFDGELLYQKDSRIKSIQSSDSKYLKFKKILCADCNGSKSQSFDNSYSVFIDFCLNHFASINERGYVDFKEIFLSNPVENKINVLKYFIKHFLTRIAQNQISLDSSIVDFLNGYGFFNSLFINIEIRADLWGMIQKIKRDSNTGGNFYLSPVQVIGSGNEIDIVYSNFIVQWIKIEFFYTHRLNSDSNIDLKDFYYKDSKWPIRSLYYIHPDNILSDDFTFEKFIDSNTGNKINENFSLIDYFSETIMHYG